MCPPLLCPSDWVYGCSWAYSSALHWLSEIRSLDKSARSQNPHGIAGSYHWNCAYCHMQYSRASHKFIGLSVQVVFILSGLAELGIILFIVHVSTDRIHQLLEPCHCRSSWHIWCVRNKPLFPSTRLVVHWCLSFLNPSIIDLQLKTSNEIFSLIWPILCSLLALLMIELCGLGLLEDPGRKGISKRKEGRSILTGNLCWYFDLIVKGVRIPVCLQISNFFC